MSVRMELLTNNASSPDPLHQEVVYKRPLSYSKMECLIKEMQDPETGVPVRSQKVFLSSIPAAFAGYDCIEWLMERLSIEDSVEAIHLANLLCQHGYFFPVGDNRNFSVKDDSSLYRFQTPYYWPSQVPTMDSIDYAVYLAKRTLRNKQKHALDDYEVEAFGELRKNLSQKWDFITMQADEQVRIGKERKKVDKLVIDSQERAFWRVIRPPPGVFCCVETPPMYKADFHAHEGTKQIRRTNILEDLRAEVDLLRTSCIRTRIKVSHALETLASHCESYSEHDPFLVARQPSNPWQSDDLCYWIINAPLVEVPTERRVKKWGISMEDLVFDPTGLREFTAYLKKEYCHENIRFWLAVRDMRFGPICQLRTKAQQIYNEFLSPGAPCEINIDMRTMEAVQKELNYLTPSRFTFDPAADHVYLMLLKKDCYPRFIRSELYKGLQTNALQPNQKKRLDKFFSFVAPGKKKSSTTTPPTFPFGTGMSLQSGGFGIGDDLLFSSGNKCDLMSASSQDTDKLSVLADCPYRSQASIDDVCPWESMEKLPSEKSASTSAPIAVPSPKPSTSAAAAAAFSKSSPKILPSTSTNKSDDEIINKSTRSGPVSKQSSILSKQSSVASTSTQDPHLPFIAAAVARRASHQEQSFHQLKQLQQSSIILSISKSADKDSFQNPNFQGNSAVTVPLTLSGITALDNGGVFMGSSAGHSGPTPTSSGSMTKSASGNCSVVQLTSANSNLSESSTSSNNPTAVAVLTPTNTIGSGSGNISIGFGTSGSSNTPTSSSITPSSSTLNPSGSSEKSEVTLREKENYSVQPVELQKTRILSASSISRTSSKDIKEEDEGSGGVVQGRRESTCIMSMSEGSANEGLNNRKNSVAIIETSPPMTGMEGVPSEHKRKQSREEDVCPWDHENGTRPETNTFVKTYSTLGYL